MIISEPSSDPSDETNRPIEFRKSNVSTFYPNSDGSLDARMNERNLSWERQTRRLLA